MATPFSQFLKSKSVEWSFLPSRRPSNRQPTQLAPPCRYPGHPPLAPFPHLPAPAPTTSHRGFRPSLSTWSLQSHLTRPPSASSLSRSPVPHTLPRLSSHSDGQSEVPQSEVRCPPSLATSFPLPLSAPSPAATLAPRALLRRPTLAYGRLPQASLTPLTLLPRHHPSPDLPRWRLVK